MQARNRLPDGSYALGLQRGTRPGRSLERVHGTLTAGGPNAQTSHRAAVDSGSVRSFLCASRGSGLALEELLTPVRRDLPLATDAKTPQCVMETLTSLNPVRGCPSIAPY